MTHMNDDLCPKCGAYWKCDCPENRVYPLLDYVIVEEAGEIPEDVHEYLMHRLRERASVLIQSMEPTDTTTRAWYEP